MKHNVVTINKITADDGMWLTNGETFSKEVYLGRDSSAENWHEITEEEYQAIIAEENTISEV